MEKFIKFTQKYYIKELALIFVVGLILFVLYFGKQGAYLVDVGREAYIPWQMLEGKLLYKDIYNVYGPLGYQINALAYRIFGIHLNTLYIMGFLNSLLILFTTFFISKIFTDRKTSLCIVGLTMFVCVYAKGFFNFIFVYSYSAVYALTSFLLSVLAMLFYIKDRKNLYLMSAFLFAGFSFANKIENLPYFGLLFLVLPLFKLKWKHYLCALASFMLFPLISFGILFLQGVSVQDLANAVVYIRRLVHTPAVEYFYYNYGLYFNPLHIEITLNHLFNKFLPVICVSTLVLYGLNFASAKFQNNRFLKVLVNFAVVFFMIYVNLKLFGRFESNNRYTFNWMALACLTVTAGFGLYYAFNFFKDKNIFKNMTIYNKMFLFLLISSLSVSLKGFSDISLECYGTFSLAALFIPFVIFFVCFIPEIFKFVNQNIWSKTLRNLCMMVMIAFLFLNVHRIGTMPMIPVKTDTGMVFVDFWLKSQNKLISYIKENTPKDAVIVSVPEGAIINFLSGRKSNDYYYYLIPVNVQVFGQEKVLSDFKKNPPDYFIVNSVIYTPFNTGSFCQFSDEICKFILENYQPVFVADDLIKQVLYKKK